jgi:flagellar hook-associated protein 2
MTTAPVSFSDLESGLDTSSIINAEMSIYEQPLDADEARQTAVNAEITDYQTINSQLLSLQQAADALADPAAFDEAFSASSSDDSVATGTITSGASAGSVTLAVDQLATGSIQVSEGTVASTDDVVASGTILVGSGGASLGLNAIGAGSGLSEGSHTISVTQASAGATVSASSPLASSTTITGSNDELDLDVDGSPLAIDLAPGTYTPAQLAEAITQASGGVLDASVGSGGLLSVATTQQGSSATLEITGGSALATLGLAAGPERSGTDGEVDVDGTTTTVSDISGSGPTQVTLDSGTGGSITATITGGLSAGSMTAQNVSVGDGSLSSVVSAINGADAGVTATALQVGTDQFALEVASTGTGTVGAATIDTQAFATSSLGTMQTTTAAQNAVVSLGGAGGEQITSSTNSVTGLLPGLTVDLSQVDADPVTISVSPDGSQVASQVSSLVNAANQVLSTISTDSAYDASTKTAGPLNGDVQLPALVDKVLSIVGEAVGTSAAGSDGTAGESAGIAITSSGTITFDETAFEQAYDADPQAVQSMFTEGGSFAPSGPAYADQVTVAGATDGTAPGSYAVTLSQSAALAVDTGSTSFGAPTSTVAGSESYTITSGTQSATYAASAGESIENVVSGLNDTLAAAGIPASASLTGSAGSYQVRLQSAAYGSAATFEVSTSGSDQLGLTSAGSTYTGSDVEGTIDGQPATGSGQFLSLSDPGDPADGLVLQITTPGVTSPTAIGSVDYDPGMAQGLAHVAEQASLSPDGEIPVTIAGLQGTVKNLTSEIALQQQVVDTQQASLTQEFTALEETLSRLNSESAFLAEAGQVESSSASSGSSDTSSASSALSGES